MTKASENIFPKIEFAEGAAPATPASGQVRLYAKSSGLLYSKDDAGAETALGGGLADQGTYTYLDATEAAAPATPASGKVRLYAKSDGLLYSKDDAGAETVVSGGGGGGSDLVQTWSGGGSVYISGLAGSPDIRVAGTNDDEFETTDTSDPMTGWTTLGSPTAHDMNSTAKSHYYVKQAQTNSVAWHGIYKAIPSVPFTVTCKVSDGASWKNYQQVGLLLIESGPGKLASVQMVYNTTPKIDVEYFTDRTTYSSTWSAGMEAYGYSPVYLRWVVTSQTNIASYVSFGGHLWRLLESGRNPGFTIAYAGLGVNSNNDTYDGMALFDWIRFT